MLHGPDGPEEGRGNTYFVDIFYHPKCNIVSTKGKLFCRIQYLHSSVLMDFHLHEQHQGSQNEKGVHSLTLASQNNQYLKNKFVQQSTINLLVTSKNEFSNLRI